MKRIYEFITKANQILLFLVVVVAVGVVAYVFYQESSRRYTPPHVGIAQTPEAIKRIVVEDVRWLGVVAGTHYFGIVKKEVTSNRQPERLEEYRAGITGSGGYGDMGQIVNVVFSGENQKVTTLLAVDGLVLSNRLFPDDSVRKLRASLFICVTDDTDGNHLLDKNDRNDLYVVPHDMTKAHIVIKNVMDSDVLTETRLLIKIRESDGLHFIVIDIETLERREVTWK